MTECKPAFPQHRVLHSRRGSALAAALAIALLIFAVTALSIARVAAIYSEASRRQSLTSALFLAEAGIQKAAHRLAKDSSYVGENGTRMPTGTFAVSVARSSPEHPELVEGPGAYVVTSTGYADSPVKRHPKKTVRARVSVGGGRFRISDWREDP